MPASKSPVGQQKFILWRGYFIYEPAAGLPDQTIAAGTPFASIPPNWRCPDCGTEKTTFRPYIEPGGIRAGQTRKKSINQLVEPCFCWPLPLPGRQRHALRVMAQADKAFLASREENDREACCYRAPRCVCGPSQKINRASAAEYHWQGSEYVESYGSMPLEFNSQRSFRCLTPQAPPAVSPDVRPVRYSHRSSRSRGIRLQLPRRPAPRWASRQTRRRCRRPRRA
jgi:rubredoxin